MKQANQTKSQYKPPNASGSKPRYQFKASQTLWERALHYELKLTRFRGHRTVCVQEVHDGQDTIALRS
jgi:hypothetical protein